jgi:hypothetical protein
LKIQSPSKLSLGYGLFSATAGGETLQRKDNDSNIARKSTNVAFPQNVNEWCIVKMSSVNGVERKTTCIEKNEAINIDLELLITMDVLVKSPLTKFTGRNGQCRTH